MTQNCDSKSQITSGYPETTNATENTKADEISK